MPFFIWSSIRIVKVILVECLIVPQGSRFVWKLLSYDVAEFGRRLTYITTTYFKQSIDGVRWYWISTKGNKPLVHPTECMPCLLQNIKAGLAA